MHKILAWFKKMKLKRWIKKSSLSPQSKKLWQKDADDVFKNICYKKRGI